MKDIDLTASNIEDEIDKYLKKLYATKEYKLFFHHLYEYHVMNNDGGVIDETMISRGLIKVIGELRMLTPLGIEINERGGWKKHLEKKGEKERLENDRLKHQDLKLQYDLKVSKFLARTKAWPLVISFISLLVSISSFFKDQIIKWLSSF